MSENTKQTIIENGTEFEGSMRSDCAITLSGKLKGQVSAPSLTVTPSGTVTGQVKVDHLTAQGEIAGEIEAEAVELCGRVNDDTIIRARTLEVSLSQPEGGLKVTFGNCDLQVGEKRHRSEQRTKEDKGKKERPVETDMLEAVGALMK